MCPCGVIKPQQLRMLADVAEKYNAAALKITSAARIAIVGLQEEDVDSAWTDPWNGSGTCGGPLCAKRENLSRHDVLPPGQTGQPENGHGTWIKSITAWCCPSKMKMAVSGCKIQCAENCIKDISLFGTQDGWTLCIGGNGSARPRLADVLIENLSDQEAKEMISRFVEYYKENSKRERVGRMVERIGLETIKSDLNIN